MSDGRMSARPTPAVGQVRGVLAERVVVSTPLDPFLSLRALAGYSGLSIRKLRDFLEQPQHPLPCYRVGGKILVRCGEFDSWIAAYRQHGRRDVDAIVSDVLCDLQPRRSSMRTTRSLTVTRDRV
jgi:hypothetical protein